MQQRSSGAMVCYQHKIYQHCYQRPCIPISMGLTIIMRQPMHTVINVLKLMQINNSPVSNLLRPLNRSTEDSFIQGQPRPKVKCSQITSRKCLNLSLKQQKQLYTSLKFIPASSPPPPKKKIKDGKMESLGFRAASFLISGEWGFAVPFHSVQE